MELLSKIFDFITGHVHPIATLPPVPISSGNGQSTEEIYSILANAQNSILNQNIRINWYLYLKEVRCQYINHISVEIIP